MIHNALSNKIKNNNFLLSTLNFFLSTLICTIITFHMDFNTWTFYFLCCLQAQKEGIALTMANYLSNLEHILPEPR